MRRLVFYGDDLVSIDIPDDSRVVEAPEPLPGLYDYEAEVRKAVGDPLGYPPLKRLVGPASRITVAFDDACLPLPPMRRDVRGRAIDVILGELFSAGVRRENVTLICANGLHRKWTPSELRFILGKKVWSEMGAERVTNHDAEDRSSIVDLGESPGGHPVRINKVVTESDLLIYVNVNWTSMNGGWKSVLVGLGDYPSISAHHNVTVVAEGGSVMDPSARFHEIMRDMGTNVNDQARVFTVETVLNNRVWGPFCNRLFALGERSQPLVFKMLSAMPQSLKGAVSSVLRSAYEPICVNAGSMDRVHSRTLNILNEQQNIKVEGQTDALIIGLPNISPYSSFSRINPLLVANTALGYVFNMHLGRPPVRRDGVLILVQPFIPGFNLRHHPSYAEFFEKVLQETREPSEMESGFEKEFAENPRYIERYRYGNAYHGVHPFYVWYWGAMALEHLGRVIVVGARDTAVTERMGFENADSVELALGMASETLGNGFNITHLSLPPIFTTEVV